MESERSLFFFWLGEEAAENSAEPRLVEKRSAERTTGGRMHRPFDQPGLRIVEPVRIS